MLRITGNNLEKLTDYGFIGEGNEICYWNNGIKKIIIHKSDGRIRFNCMDIQSYDILFDLIVNHKGSKLAELALQKFNKILDEAEKNYQEAYLEKVNEGKKPKLTLLK